MFATPGSLDSSAITMDGEGEQTRRRRLLTLIYLVMGPAALLIGMLPEVLERLYGLRVDTGFWPWILIALAGTFSTLVTSLLLGTIGGALVALIFSLSGGFVFLLFGHAAPEDAAKIFLSSVVITTVLGSCLGFLGGVPVWLWKAWKKRRAEQSPGGPDSSR
jgi:hypothetical protein